MTTLAGRRLSRFSLPRFDLGDLPGFGLAVRAIDRLQEPLLRHSWGLAFFRRARRQQPRFRCPLCDYRGPFRAVRRETHLRRHAACPRCGSVERHRMQYLVLRRLATLRDLSTMSLLHFAPERCLERVFRSIFGRYSSAEVKPRRSGRAERVADLRDLPFRDRSYDIVFASHVLEHVKEDGRALSEICRVLKPDGIAVLPVPIIALRTVEYPRPNPHEAGHVRAPGLDYYDRYSKHFRRVDLYESIHFSEEFQPFIYEDRSSWPRTMPLRPTMEGRKHRDIVPVCFK